MRNIPPDAAKRVDEYSLTDEIRYASALPGLAQKPRTNDASVAALQRRIGPLIPVFTEPSTKHTSALRAAAQWLFDSQAERNQTRALVFVSLGLESLLGGDRADSDKVGVGRLLANRLAYLLGGTRDERDVLIREFDVFYGKRSAIVHGSAVRLDSSGRECLSKARAWLHLAIARELRFTPS